MYIVKKKIITQSLSNQFQLILRLHSITFRKAEMNGILKYPYPLKWKVIYICSASIHCKGHRTTDIWNSKLVQVQPILMFHSLTQFSEWSKFSHVNRRKNLMTCKSMTNSLLLKPSVPSSAPKPYRVSINAILQKCKNVYYTNHKC